MKTNAPQNKRITTTIRQRGNVTKLRFIRQARSLVFLVLMTSVSTIIVVFGMMIRAV